MRKRKKERKVIQSITIEPSTIVRMMEKTGQMNFSEIVRDALKEYEKILDNQAK